MIYNYDIAFICVWKGLVENHKKVFWEEQSLAWIMCKNTNKDQTSVYVYDDEDDDGD